jgi:integrase
MVLGAGWPEEWRDLVFVSEAGTPIDPANARRELRALAEGAGLQGVTPYTLRHTAASLMAQDGRPIEHIADVLGHDGIRMARLVYVHATAPSVDTAVESMERMLG